jgi:hypothetical protein
MPAGITANRPAREGGMSEQSDALNKIVRERGVHVDGPSPALPGLEHEAGRPELPHVKLPRSGKQLRSFAKEIGAIVGANGLFRRESVPVTIDPETSRIEDMGAARFRSYVEDQLVTFEEQYSRKAGVTIIPETMSGEEARGCLDCDAFRYPLRKLTRVNAVRLPVMRADGRIELLPRGYDSESGIFTKKDCLEYDTEWELDRAKLFYDTFLTEFPFANESIARGAALRSTGGVWCSASPSWRETAELCASREQAAIRKRSARAGCHCRSVRSVRADPGDQRFEGRVSQGAGHRSAQWLGLHLSR